MGCQALRRASIEISRRRQKVSDGRGVAEIVPQFVRENAGILNLCCVHTRKEGSSRKVFPSQTSREIMRMVARSQGADSATKSLKEDIRSAPMRQDSA